MRREYFNYELPIDLIAHQPTAERRDSKMLILESQNDQVRHKSFSEITSLVRPGDLLVLNDTKVMPARMFGKKDTGGKIEMLVERLVDRQSVLAHLRASKTPKVGSMIIFEGLSLIHI